ncbi:MAG: hypothetical protein AAF443_02980 [Chlamydiota bacterium]
MLDFFRRYQRFFFIIVAVFIVSSIAFFGVNYAIRSPQQSRPTEIGRAVDGSVIWSDEIDHLVRLIATDQADQQLLDKGIVPNLLNDGVIRQDFLVGKLGEILARAYFDVLKPELRERVTKHRRYQPYVHPYVPSISVENLWQQFASKDWEKIKAFLAEADSEVTAETFTRLVDFYQLEKVFPPRAVRQYLYVQQQNYQGVPKDPALATSSLGLFHCNSLEDWFGARFVRLVAQFIHNASLIAEERGYRISETEVRLDLGRHAYQALKQQGKKEKESQEISTLYYNQLLRLGLNEKEAIRGWRKVMLFRRLFADYGNAVIADPLPYEVFYPFASEMVTFDLYRLPQALELHSFRDVLKLNFYLDAVTSLAKDKFFLPTEFLSVDRVEAQFPELIEQRAWVETAEVSIDAIAASVSLKEMWDWQLQDDHYAQLEREFPSLAFKKERSADAYFEMLEKLEADERHKVDGFSRRAIVRAHPEWIEQALDQKTLIEKEIKFSPNGEGGSPIEQTECGSDWVKLLQTAALKGILETDEAALKAREALSCFTPDEMTYYRFIVVERDLTKQVRAFSMANEAGILDRLLDQQLESQYSLLRAQDPKQFQTEEKEWKVFDTVKNEVGELFYTKRLRAIKRQCEKRGVAISKEKCDRRYLYACFIEHLHEHLAACRKEAAMAAQSESAVAPTNLGTHLKKRKPLATQWDLRKEEQTVKKCDHGLWLTADAFSWDEASWSPVLGGKDRTPYFFFLRKKSLPTGPFRKEIKQGQKILADEAKQLLMLEVIDTLKKKGGIHLSTHKD